MPKFSKSVEVPGQDSRALYGVVSSEIERFLAKTPMSDYKLHRDETRCEIKLDSKMANLVLKCTDNRLDLDGSLSFLAMPFKSKLEEGIDRWIHKIFHQKG